MKGTMCLVLGLFSFKGSFNRLAKKKRGSFNQASTIKL